MSTEPTIITRDISAGEVFTHTGPVEVRGNIGDGAQLDIKKGGVHVTGSVGKQVYIETSAASGGSNSISISGSGNSIISGSNIVMVNGKIISGDVNVINGNDQGPTGITIDGSVGDGTTLQTKGSIEVSGTVGAKVNAFAAGSVSLKDAGDDLSARAGGSFEARLVGARAQITGGGTAEVEELGHNSRVTGGGTAHLGRVGNSCVVTGGGMAQAKTLGKGSILTGGGMARVDLAHDSAMVNAGGMKRVSRTSSNDSDFTLQPIAGPIAPAAPAPAPVSAPQAPAADDPAHPTIGLKFKL